MTCTAFFLYCTISFNSQYPHLIFCEVRNRLQSVLLSSNRSRTSESIPFERVSLQLCSRLYLPSAKFCMNLLCLDKPKHELILLSVCLRAILAVHAQLSQYNRRIKHHVLLRAQLRTHGPVAYWHTVFNKPEMHAILL